MNTSFLFQALVFMGAAILLVPIAKKIGLSSVLGYLVAGVLIGPFILGFVGKNGQDIMHAAEFGVVMMLFLIGLELNPHKFWEMRKAIVGLGSIQLIGTTLLLFILFLLLQWDWRMALAVSLAFSMSSTAIVLQTLKEKNLSQSVSGEASFAVLLFQDIAVIPILAILPLLETQPNIATNNQSSLFADQPAWIQAISVLGAVAFILFIGKFLVVPLLRFVSKTHMRELFVASALFLVVGVATLMQAVGLSPALGTFIAGVVLANTEFRHQLESDIEPFKGLLLGLFFMSVGATIDFTQISQDPLMIASLVGLVLSIKFVVLMIVGRVFKMSSDQKFIFSFGLSQVGEFAFVLLSFSNQIQLIDETWTAKLMAVVAITMASTPLFILINEKVIEPYWGVKTIDDKPPHDTIDTHYKVIIAGFGHFGSTIGRFLRANNIQATILDNDSDRVNLLRKMGFEVYYGDATRLDLLEAAKASEATLLIAAIDPPEANQELIEVARKHFPHLTIMARSRNRFDAYEMMDMGVKHIYRETLYTAVHLGIDALVQLGFRKYTATRQGQKFIQFDESALEKLAKSRHDMKDYVLSVKEQIQWQEQILQNDLKLALGQTDISWDSEYLRQTFTQNQSES
ncbi:MAG: monovalent cation:proton antiporter-2 (CPA2) family protein [Raineya sp.]|jgi:CPA2 family monovalent cation:H+ antiporter-2|nr:monovalent cation:proton antiporter-2 (CPA2) family protein [Raineya sp.]